MSNLVRTFVDASDPSLTIATVTEAVGPLAVEQLQRLPEFAPGGSGMVATQQLTVSTTLHADSTPLSLPA